MSDDHDSVISQFTNVTGVDADRAKFYLESSDWKLQEALTTFYDASAQDGSGSSSDPEIVNMSEQDDKPKPTGSKPKPTKSSSSRIATFNTLAQDDSSEEEGQAFYAGGSDRSGQQVLGPKKKKNFVDEVFKSVQEHGAEIIDPSEASSSSRTPNVRFTGTGYRLGASENDTEVIRTSTTSATDNKPVDVVLKMWRDGFSINDGPLREYTDPANQEFLDSIKHGVIPRELVMQAGETSRREINLDMEDHRHEKFVQPKQKLKPFVGTGYTLGSPAPVTVGAVSENVQDQASNEQAARDSLKLDSAQPTTSIQIRLADGSRIVGQFNNSHTIDDVRRYIVTARPQYTTQTFALLSTFPSRELSDVSQTLEQAGVLNSAIMQRLK